jgi:ATP-dependent 26S proteasome regulatory subunit
VTTQTASPSSPPVSRAFSALQELIQGGRTLIYICSPEESRIQRLLEEAAARLLPARTPVLSWASTTGLLHSDGSSASATPLDEQGVLEFIAAWESPAIFQLKDFNVGMRDNPVIRRRLRDLYSQCLDKNKFLVFTSPLRDVPEDLSRQMAIMDLLAPDLDELLDFTRREMARLGEVGAEVDLGDDSVYAISRALQGLTLDEAGHALRRALAVSGKLDPTTLVHILEEKKLIVNKSGLIQYVSDGTRLDHVGGLEYLKAWLMERRKLFLERESLSHEIVPKGLLVMGVSGCGKSLSVKAIAHCFELPLYRIDMIEVFSGKHGNPDAAFVQACRVVESVAPAVVWFDEIEMGLTGQVGEGNSNLGRIFAFFLTWMQEKTRGLFVAATANRIDLLPAEMIRKGRFDEVFFIDLPTEDERTDIFRIHLLRRGLQPEALQLHRLKRISLGWTGAEIEQCVVSAITTAKIQGKALTFDDLHLAAQNIIPLSKTMREQCDHIRSWAYERAIRASPRELK